MRAAEHSYLGDSMYVRINGVLALCFVAVALPTPTTALPYHKWHWDKKPTAKTQSNAWHWNKPDGAASSQSVTQSDSNCQTVGPVGNKVHVCQLSNDNSKPACPCLFVVGL